MGLLDRIMVVGDDNVGVELSPEIKQRMEAVFNEAVDRESEEHFLDGVETVLNCLVKIGMDGSKRLVLERLISDGVVEIDSDGGNDEEEEEDGGKDEGREKATQNESRWMDDIVRMIG